MDVTNTLRQLEDFRRFLDEVHSLIADLQYDRDCWKDRAEKAEEKLCKHTAKRQSGNRPRGKGAHRDRT